MKIKAGNTQSTICPNCGMSYNAKELNNCMYCGHGVVASLAETETETEKEEIAAVAEPCDPEDCAEDVEGPEDWAEDAEDEDDEEDEEFMDSISECMDAISEEPKKKMAPEQSKKRREYLENRNKEIRGNLERNEQVAELAGHYGLQVLITDLEASACADVKNHEIEDATKSIKSLKAVLTFKSLVSTRRDLITNLKSELSGNEAELQRLDAPQLTLFDNTPQGKEAAEVA